MWWHAPYNPVLESGHTEQEAAAEQRYNKNTTQIVFQRISDIIHCCDVTPHGSTVTVISVNNEFQHKPSVGFN